MHLIARLDDRESDRYLLSLTETHQLAPGPLSATAIERDAGQGLLLSFTNIPIDQAPAMADRLARVIEG